MGEGPLLGKHLISIGTSSTKEAMPELALLSLRSRTNAEEWNEHVFAPLHATPLEPSRAIEHLADLPLRDFGVVRRLDVIYDMAQDSTLLDDPATKKLVASVVGQEQSEEAWNLAREVSLAGGLDDLIRRYQSEGMISPLLRAIKRPVCDATKRADGSIEITASYETDGAVKDFYFGADPVNWPTCNPFFVAMNRRGGWFSLPPADSVNGRGYGSRVEEVVGAPPFFTWTTYLKVRYFVAKAAVGMEFEITDGGDGAIDVDHGFVVVEERPNQIVNIRSEKTVRFTKLPNAPAEFACSLGWIDMMQGMALCEGDCLADLANLAETSTRTHVDRIAKACEEAMAGSYGAEELTRDTAAFWSQVFSDTVMAGLVTGKYLARYAKGGKEPEGTSGD
ncbi:MAG TPA: hypothetical protein VIA81_02920 [Acidimicrobiia bacterium]